MLLFSMSMLLFSMSMLLLFSMSMLLFSMSMLVVSTSAGVGEHVGRVEPGVDAEGVDVDEAGGSVVPVGSFMAGCSSMATDVAPTRRQILAFGSQRILVRSVLGCVGSAESGSVCLMASWKSTPAAIDAFSRRQIPTFGSHWIHVRLESVRLGDLDRDLAREGDRVSVSMFFEPLQLGKASVAFRIEFLRRVVVQGGSRHIMCAVNNRFERGV